VACGEFLGAVIAENAGQGCESPTSRVGTTALPRRRQGWYSGGTPYGTLVVPGDDPGGIRVIP
jgi:hypothetical protein